MTMDFWITQTFNGLSYGVLLFLFASGLTLIFGVMKIGNLAHGSYYLLAGHMGLTMMRFTDNYVLAIIGAAVVIVLVGIVMVRVFPQGLAPLLV